MLKETMKTDQHSKLNTTNIKDDKLRKLRKFCRILEKNMNNFIASEYLNDPNKIPKGYSIKIESVNGIKKIFPKNTVRNPKNKYFLRFFITFFNQKTSEFFGNTFKSPLLKIKFTDSGHYELAESDPLYVYFLSNLKNEGKNIAFCIIEVIFVETTEDERILSQTCEGWGLLEVEETNSGQKGLPTSVFMGTPRNLLHKALKSNPAINGASIIYSCNGYKELEKIRFLLPNFVILGSQDSLPGLLLRFLPPKPIYNEPLKLVEFSDIFIKNVEIEIHDNLEQRLINSANLYRRQKLGI